MKPKKTTTRPSRPKPVTFTQAEFRKGSLSQLMRLYRQLWESIDDLGRLTDFGDPLDMLIQNHMSAPLERGLLACHAAIKATEPKDDRETEARAALLYRHALRFDAHPEERRNILSGALLAIPASKDLKTEVYRFPKHVGGGEMTTVRKGNRIVWRGFSPERKPKRKAAKA